MGIYERTMEWLKRLFNPEPLNPKYESLPFLIQEDGSLKGKSDPIPPILTATAQKPTSQQIRAHLYDTMLVNDNIVDLNGRVLVSGIKLKIDVIVNKMLSNKSRYEYVSKKFPNPIRWYHIACLHQMEGELNFNTYLGNGQSIYKKTTIVPKGRGPFPSFEAGAIDSIIQEKLNLVQDWSVGNTLEILERFNGWGYANRGINSPYLWSGTNHYNKGKYVSDGKFDPNYVSRQIGIAPIMKVLLERI